MWQMEDGGLTVQAFYCTLGFVKKNYSNVTLISITNLWNKKWFNTGCGKPSGSEWYLILTISHRFKWTLLCWPTYQWPLQSPKTTSFYIRDCVSVTLKPDHTHYCHATLTTDKTHCYNWLHCTLYPLWTGQLANANNSAVTGREPNPCSCLSGNQAWQII